MDTEHVLEVQGLQVRYITDDGIAEAVNGIDFSLKPGDTLGLVGETGAGKTTTALSIMRLVPDPPGRITAGNILFNGENLLEKREREMRRIRGNKISMIFQDPMTSLNPVFTVGRQIAENVQLHQGVSYTRAQKRAAEMLDIVGIPGARIDSYPHEFSGGMKQRVGIAMALACSPAVLIADEPTTALDVTIQAQILEIMKELKEQFRSAMIMISHDLGVVAEVADQAAVMYAGNLVETGAVEQVFSSPQHPYTVGLVASIPDIDSYGKSRLSPIEGLMPDAMELPAGCSFHPRCPRVMDRCRREKPPMYRTGSEGQARCFLFDRSGGAHE